MFRFRAGPVSSSPVDLFRCYCASVLSQIPWGRFASVRRREGSSRVWFGRVVPCDAGTGSQPSLVWPGCSVCGLFFPPISLVFVSILFRLRLLRVWVAGSDRIGCWEFVMASCGVEMEAGQSSVRSGGSLVLSLGHGFGGFRPNCLPVFWHQIVPS